MTIEPAQAISRSPMLKRASTYEDAWKQVDFRNLKIPSQFNLGIACLDDQNPDSVAITVVRPDRTHVDYTFGAVLDMTNRFANALTRLGVGRGDVVAVVNPQSLETAIFYMAVFRLGAIALPLSSLFGPDGLSYRLDDSGANLVLVSQDNLARVRTAVEGTDVRIIVEGEPGIGEYSWRELLAAESSEFHPVQTNSEDPAFLIYTSGTTGNPKGVLHAHRIIFGQLMSFEFAWDFAPQPGDVLWSPADWAWIAGLMDILVPGWYYGLRLVVDTERGFDPERILWLMREHRVSLTLLPPTALRAIKSSGFTGGDFVLRAVASGSEIVGPELLQWCEEFFGCAVNEVYGQTEFNGICGGNERVFPARPGSLGRAFPGTVVAVLDANDDPVVGEIGEIAIDRHHPLTLLEYWRNPAATAQKIRGNWVLTGDLGTLDEDGYLWFKSRADDVIKSSGYRIGPGEIENCLCTHPGVAAAGVLGVPDERRGQVPKAWVIPREGWERTAEFAEELRDHVRTRLAVHEVPREIVWIDELPRTATGKVIRSALRDA